MDTAHCVTYVGRRGRALARIGAMSALALYKQPDSAAGCRRERKIRNALCTHILGLQGEMVCEHSGGLYQFIYECITRGCRLSAIGCQCPVGGGLGLVFS